MAVNPITHVELEAWQRLRKVTLFQWELDAIFAIDGAFMDSIDYSTTPKTGT